MGTVTAKILILSKLIHKLNAILNKNVHEILLRKLGLTMKFMSEKNIATVVKETFKKNKHFKIETAAI